ncbi:hypothetical protein J1N35_015093 [Gossypium stocksii]|uniref:Uncharacterized protein n=1 Tax=Gossypium stocksii TaxID=47602 RepID=A0A9D3VVP7_9ROSI|nr:hypothetical protein J1N35_015093 [Gossypium stocksii]
MISQMVAKEMWCGINAMDVCETYNERKIGGARDINSHEPRGVRSLSSHIPKKFACEGPRGLVGNPKWYMCPACPRPTQNVSLMNSGVKSMNSGVKS